MTILTDKDRALIERVTGAVVDGRALFTSSPRELRLILEAARQEGREEARDDAADQRHIDGLGR